MKSKALRWRLIVKEYGDNRWIWRWLATGARVWGDWMCRGEYKTEKSARRGAMRFARKYGLLVENEK